MRGLIACLLVIALAGCSESASPAPAADDFQDVKVDKGANVGAISGVVVSELIVPVEGATVTLTGQGVSQVTNENGQFTFEDLDPGVYFVAAEAPTFLPSQTSVEVVAGDVATPRLLLSKDPAPQPYIASEQFQGHMVASDILVVYVLSDIIGNNDLCRCEFTYTSDPGVETIVLETYWDSSYQRLQDHEMYWDFWGGSGGHDAKFIAEDEVWHISGASYDSAETEWRALISSDLQPDVEQSFEGFVTFWHLAPAPEGWSLNA